MFIFHVFVLLSFNLAWINCRCSFGIAFDVDGVVLSGRVPVGGSPQALRRLYSNSGMNCAYSLLLLKKKHLNFSRRYTENQVNLKNWYFLLFVQEL